MTKRFPAFFLVLSLLLTTVVSEAIERHIRYGDRYFVASVLMEVFGDKSQAIVDRHILSFPEVFGGACVLMEEIAIEDKELKKPQQVGSKFACRQSLPESKTSPFTRTPVSRNALVQRACEDLTANPQLLIRALAGAYPLQDRLDIISAVVLRFYPLIKRPRDFAQRVVEIFGPDEVDESMKPNFNLWLSQVMQVGSAPSLFNGKGQLGLYQKTVLNLCMSEEWQVP
jgi:hypothetical protein